MRFAFSEEQLALAGAVRQVLERECTVADLRDIAEHRSADGGRSAQRWATLSDLGALGLLVPTEHGGVGLSDVDLVGVMEESGWAALPEPLAENAGLVAPLLVATIGKERVGELLGSIVDGTATVAVGGVAITSSGLQATSAMADGEFLQTPVTGGARRANAFLFCHHAEAGWQIHLVERGDVALREVAALDGTRDLGNVAWQPSPATVLAEGALAADLVAQLCDRASSYTAAQLLGITHRMIAMTADYAKDRQQFNKPIGSFQAVKHHLANARVKLEFARPATYRSADSIARDLSSRTHDCSMAKALASDAADFASRIALQVHGAIGYTWECDLQLWMKRAWALSREWGDAPTHRARVLAAAVADLH